MSASTPELTTAFVADKTKINVRRRLKTTLDLYRDNYTSDLIILIVEEELAKLKEEILNPPVVTVTNQVKELPSFDDDDEEDEEL